MPSHDHSADPFFRLGRWVHRRRWPVLAVWLLVVLAAVYGLVLWADKARTDRSAIVGLYLLYGLPGGLLTVAGLALVVNGRETGWFVLALGLAFALPLVRPFRRLMAMLTPMESTTCQAAKVVARGSTPIRAAPSCGRRSHRRAVPRSCSTIARGTTERQ